MYPFLFPCCGRSTGIEGCVTRLTHSTREFVSTRSNHKSLGTVEPGQGTFVSEKIESPVFNGDNISHVVEKGRTGTWVPDCGPVDTEVNLVEVGRVYIRRSHTRQNVSLRVENSNRLGQNCPPIFDGSATTASTAAAAAATSGLTSSQDCGQNGLESSYMPLRLKKVKVLKRGIHAYVHPFVNELY